MTELAIHGGRPVRKEFLPYGHQTIDNKDVKAVIDVLKSDYLTTGPAISLFENKIKSYVGVDYAIAISNGTAALHAACFAAGIKEGDEVIVSSITFAASSNAVLYCGATPVFADIDPITYNIDPNSIRELINDKTKAIVVVDYTGQPVDIDEIMEIARRNNLIVIQDSAHSLGSEYKGEMIGKQADMTTFSFHPVKPITTAEGGMVVTNNIKYAELIRLFRSHGITRDEDQLLNDVGPWYYEQQLLGYNYRMTDIQAILGVSQLEKIETFLSKRRKLAKLYNNLLENISGITIPEEPEYSNSGWHIYVIKIDTKSTGLSRKFFFEALRAENIGVNVHYIPVYLMPYYKELGYEAGLCPRAEAFYEDIITLPLHPGMTEDDVRDVTKAIKKILSYGDVIDD